MTLLTVHEPQPIAKLSAIERPPAAFPLNPIVLAPACISLQVKPAGAATPTLFGDPVLRLPFINCCAFILPAKRQHKIKSIGSGRKEDPIFLSVKFGCIMNVLINQKKSKYQKQAICLSL